MREAAQALRRMGLDPIKAALAGQAYEFDEDGQIRFPKPEGVVDPKTGHSFYFHAHREGEYGHFHTFVRDQYGLAVHLILISMDEQGRATELSTLNQWITGDRYVAADDLSVLLDQYSIAPSSFAPPELVSFVTGVVKSHRALIVDLFRERDQWVADYRKRTGTDPFEDKDHPLLSTRSIGPLG